MPLTGALALGASPWGMFGTPDPSAFYQQYYQYYAQAAPKPAPVAASTAQADSGSTASPTASAPTAVDPYAQYGGYEAYCAQWQAYYASQGASKEASTAAPKSDDSEAKPDVDKPTEVTGDAVPASASLSDPVPVAAGQPESTASLLANLGAADAGSDIEE